MPRTPDSLTNGFSDEIPHGCCVRLWRICVWFLRIYASGITPDVDHLTVRCVRAEPHAVSQWNMALDGNTINHPAPRPSVTRMPSGLLITPSSQNEKLKKIKTVFKV